VLRLRSPITLATANEIQEIQSLVFTVSPFSNNNCKYSFCTFWPVTIVQ